MMMSVGGSAALRKWSGVESMKVWVESSEVVCPDLKSKSRLRLLAKKIKVVTPLPPTPPGGSLFLLRSCEMPLEGSLRPCIYCRENVWALSVLCVSWGVGLALWPMGGDCFYTSFCTCFRLALDFGLCGEDWREAGRMGRGGLFLCRIALPCIGGATSLP